MKARGAVVFLLLLLVLTKSLVLAGKTQSERLARRDMQLRRSACMSNECSLIPQDENDNCVHRCVSPACFEEIYSADPLEPGEIDEKRQNEFNRCALTELMPHR